MWVAILCHLPQYEYGSWVPKPGYEAQPSTWVVGSRDPYEYWGRWHNFCKTYLICILAQVLEINLIPYYWHFVSEGGSVSSSCKWKPVIRSPAHNPILLQLPIRLHSMTLADIQGIKTEFNTFCCGCHLHSSLTTLATSTLLLVSTVQDVGRCQLAWGTMETRFVYFLIVKWTLHSAYFNQQSSDTNLHFLARLMPFK